MAQLLDLEKARKELDQKDLLTIERETALTWGGRAAASYECAFEEARSDHAEAMRCFWEGETYRGESLEHSAMTEDADLLRRITAEIESYRSKARKALVGAGHSFIEGSRTPKGRSRVRPGSDRPRRGRRGSSLAKGLDDVPDGPM